jgi:S1-C subfamily serine protease
VVCASGFPAAADEIAEKGRAVFEKNQRAVVNVQVTLRVSSGSGSPQEYVREVSGTVIDSSGLTVLALSAADPTELNRRVSPESRVEAEVTDVKIRLDDSTELPAQVVLRDRDFDLAFVRPNTKPETALVAIDLKNSGTASVLEQVISLNRLNKAANRAYSASVERISAVVQKPRTFYIPDGAVTSTSLGCPAFLADGRVLGLFVMRAVGSSGSDRPNATPIVLPAGDVLKAASQVPEAKAE